MTPLLVVLLAASPSQFVVVPENAWLYERPDEAAPKHRVPTAHERYRAFRWVDEQPGWTQVEADARLVDTPQRGAKELHCVSASFAFPGLTVRLFVKSDALATVTTQKVEQKYADGTRLTVLPGVVVGGEHLALEHGKLKVAVPQASSGKRYRPAAALLDKGTTVDEPDPEGPLLLDGKPIELAALDSAGLSARRGEFFTFRDWCVEVTVKGRPAAPSPEGDGTDGVVGGVMGGMVSNVFGKGGDSTQKQTLWMAKKGSAVFFGDGTRAGEVVEPLIVSIDAEPTASNGRSCVCVSLQTRIDSDEKPTEPDSPLRLCFDSKGLKKTTRSAPANPFSDSTASLYGAPCPPAP